MSGGRRFIPVSHWQDGRQILGVQGERVAIAYLTSCGWSVEAHRFKLGRHDVDLVIRKGRTVAFVEVKARRTESHGSGLQAVGWRKQRDLARVASVWILRHGRPDDEYRFDVVAIQDHGAGRCSVEHLADAWRLERSWL